MRHWEILQMYRNTVQELASLWVHNITKRLNWKGPLEVMRSNHPTQAGPPRAGYQGLCPHSFWRSPGKETSQRVPVLSHLPTEKLFPDVLMFNLCPLPGPLPLGTTEKRLSPSSLYPSCIYVFIYTGNVPPPGWTVSALSVSSYRRGDPTPWSS